MERYKVAKCGYSRKPWRIIDTSLTANMLLMGQTEQGVEVWGMETLQLQDGPITVPGPLAFDRKRDAVAALAALIAGTERRLGA